MRGWPPVVPPASTVRTTRRSAAGSGGRISKLVRVATDFSVNVSGGRADPDPNGMSNVTGIDKVAVTEPVMVRAPGPMHGGVGSGLVGDTIGNQKFHGGDDQAVYAYAREDLDEWEGRLERSL